MYRTLLHRIKDFTTRAVVLGSLAACSNGAQYWVHPSLAVAGFQEASSGDAMGEKEALPYALQVPYWIGRPSDVMGGFPLVYSQGALPENITLEKVCVDGVLQEARLMRTLGGLRASIYSPNLSKFHDEKEHRLEWTVSDTHGSYSGSTPFRVDLQPPVVTSRRLEDSLHTLVEFSDKDSGVRALFVYGTWFRKAEEPQGFYQQKVKPTGPGSGIVPFVQKDISRETILSRTDGSAILDLSKYRTEDALMWNGEKADSFVLSVTVADRAGNVAHYNLPK